ncbi:MAG TPA: class I SAM-dependent methyltransferase [Thermoanaerobaculia bacterium]|jgi:SAM-dependent methyltransferase
MKIEVEWDELKSRFSDYIRSQALQWIAPGERHYEHILGFNLGRLDEGRGVGAYLLDRLKPEGTIRCLDVGGGSGGVAAGLANYRQLSVTTTEVNVRDIHRVRSATGLNFGITVSPEDKLPFESNSFDAVVSLETFEHVRTPLQLGTEIMRVMKPGAICMVTTPARLRWLFKPDPHYHVRGLLLLPDALQPYVARWRAGVTLYDVVHTYWTLGGLVSEFPGAQVQEVMWAAPRPYRSRFMNALWWQMRNQLWERVVLRKP